MEEVAGLKTGWGWEKSPGERWDLSQDNESSRRDMEDMEDMEVGGLKPYFRGGINSLWP